MDIQLIQHLVQTINFLADFSTFVNELLDAKTPEISENFTSIEDSLLCLRKQLNMDDSKETTNRT